jgi:hypothetical protein
VQINVNVALGEDDQFAYSADQAATEVLAALGGNPTKDHCVVAVNQASVGNAGVLRPPPYPAVQIPLVPPAPAEEISVSGDG